MTKRTWHIVFGAVCSVWLCLILRFPFVAHAQFETPNRSFHNATAFRLEGMHQTVACEACHVNGQFKGTPRTCYDCHWVRRKDDRFQTRLGSQCEQCHRPTSWSAVQWDHAGQAGVVLNQDHRQIPCESCHRSATFRASSVACASCHQKDFAASRSPNHAAAGFPMACDACHRPGDSTWNNTGTGGFNHNSVFALVGIHATQACSACHMNNVYQGTSRECVGCHRAQYNATRNPSHAAAGFPTTCEACHRATDLTWSSGGTFNHNSVFALVGVHATQACAACHVNSVYQGTSRDCVGCHLAQYNATKSPAHAAAGFPTTCDSCHRATDPAWGSGGTFNHNSVFALVGVHATQACTVCHVNNVYRGTARDCVGCHLAQYNATRNPAHASAGFPTTCDTCHRATDATWQQGTFNHTRFPLTGRHNVTCAQCHTTPNNFATFSCTVCHGRSETDSHHRGRSGYVYDSNACYSCHPNGRAG
jgi:hypothetical protein